VCTHEFLGSVRAPPSINFSRYVIPYSAGYGVRAQNRCKAALFDESPSGNWLILKKMKLEPSGAKRAVPPTIEGFLRCEVGLTISPN
jgi:hypothetical protein